MAQQEMAKLKSGKQWQKTPGVGTAWESEKKG